MIRRSETSCKEEVCSSNAFRRRHPVVHVSGILHILHVPGYRGTYIRGYVLSGLCSRQQISVKLKGYLFSEGYLFTRFHDNSFSRTPNLAQLPPYRVVIALTTGFSDFFSAQSVNLWLFTR